MPDDITVKQTMKVRNWIPNAFLRVECRARRPRVLADQLQVAERGEEGDQEGQHER
jgi:hypothetical protein